MPAVMCVQRFVNAFVNASMTGKCANKCSQQNCLSVMVRHIKKLSNSNCSVTKQKVCNVLKHDGIKLRLALLDYRAELGTQNKECSLLTFQLDLAEV